MDKNELEIYSDYWTEPYYVLVGPDYIGPDQDEIYSIADVERHMYALIEDSEIANYVIKKMLDKGVKVYKTWADLPQRTLPQHWTNLSEQTNFDAATRGFGFSQRQLDKLARHCLGKNYTVDEVRQKIKDLNLNSADA